MLFDFVFFPSELLTACWWTFNWYIKCGQSGKHWRIAGFYPTKTHCFPSQVLLYVVLLLNFSSIFTLFISVVNFELFLLKLDCNCKYLKRGNENMQICHSQRYKQFDMTMTKHLISIFWINIWTLLTNEQSNSTPLKYKYTFYRENW